MKKILLLLVIVTFSTLTAFNQDAKDESTKMDQFASKTGVIIKFTDYSLPNLNLTYGAAETKVRKMESADETMYFYQISHEGKYGTKTGSIAFEDLADLINALQSLKEQSHNDLTNSGDYLENKFITDDGFKVGYYISDGKLKWFIVLEKYGSGNTIFIKNVSTIEDSFNGAKQKIEELMLIR